MALENKPAPVAESKPRETGVETVTVGCKIPNGLHLDFGGKRVTLNGSNSSNIIGGYGITEGVDKAFFDAWSIAYADSPAIKNGYVFAQSSTDRAQAQAIDQSEIRTGLEPLDPESPGPNLAQEDPEKLKQQLRKKAA